MSASPPVDLLVVEDTLPDLQLALRALKKANLAARVEVARDGKEALDFIFGEGAHQGRKPADGLRLILMDLKLPKIDGLEVLRRLKSDPRTQPIPVVVLSSSVEPNDLAECYRQGANSYIVKPVGYEQFAAAVQELGVYWLTINQPLGGS